MKNWFNRNFRTLIILAFLIPIITVALVSISHVTIWYGISNPITWAIYLSVGIEIAALSALAAISANMGSKVYFPFGIVTLIQFIGNIYFSYQFIDVNAEQFKEWVELVSPLLEYIGIEGDDYIGHKRFLSLFAGGMLPIISLSFLHMLVQFTQETSAKKNEDNEEKNVIDSKDLVGEISRVRLTEDDLNQLENILIKKPIESQPEPKIKEVKKNERPSDEELFGDYLDLLDKNDNEIIPTPIPSAFSSQPITSLNNILIPTPDLTDNNQVEETTEPIQEENPLIFDNNQVEETTEPIQEEIPLTTDENLVDEIKEEELNQEKSEEEKKKN
jgi:hypothetical protein